MSVRESNGYDSDDGISCITPEDIKPRRIVESILEDSNHLNPVPPTAASAHHSRLGPEVVGREEVFHHACVGKYTCANSLSLCDPSSCTQVVTPSATSQTIDSDPLDTSADSERVVPLYIYYQNVRGLRTKIDDFFVAVSDNEYDVIILTETWLKDEINSVQLFGAGYNVYRKDRIPEVTGRSRGGGVLIAVKNSFSSTPCVACIDNDLEHLWVNVECTERRVCLGVVYIPPDLSRNRFVVERLNNSISSVAASLRVSDVHLLFGDFNLPDLCWRASTAGFAEPEPTESDSTSNILIDNMALLNMKQLNLKRNCLGRILDLCFIDEDAVSMCNLVEPLEALIPIDPMHPPFLTQLHCSAPVSFSEPIDDHLLDFSRTNFDGLQEALLTLDWSPVYNASNINEAVYSFTNVVLQLLPRFVLEHRPRMSPPWSNSRLRFLKQSRSRALRQYCNNRNSVTKQRFNDASSKYKSYKRTLYGQYVLRTQNMLKTHPKRFWSFVNKKRKENGLPSTMFLGSDTSSSTQGICNLFAKRFASVFDNTTPNQQQVNAALRDVPAGMIPISNREFDEVDILAALKKMKSSKKPGPDGIPSLILVKCADALCGPLTSIFNLSLSQAVFPECWKKSVMFPVFKNGNKCDVVNYRGVTSLCACSKLFEILINNVLFRAAKPYISQEQHGFFPGRSVVTNLVQFSSLCLTSMEQGFQIDTIYTDLKAAFDRVSHRILLAKLDRLGVSTTLVCWFESYLSNRRLCVKVGSTESEEFSNNSGVPQGSNLGPLLFTIFFNDVCLALPRGCKLLYADDLKMFWLVKTPADCQMLQNALNEFFAWCQRNLMVVSVAKCSIISYTRKKKPIQWDYTIGDDHLARTNVVRDLGVMLDSELNFREHYSHIINKARRNLGFIIRLSTEFRNPYCLRSLYYSLVRSILESAVVVWSPFRSIWSARIEKIQSKFIKYALRFLPWQNPNELPPYEARCRLLGMDTLEKRRKMQKTVFIGKVLLGDIDAPWILAKINLNVQPRTLRQRNFVRIQQHRADYAQNEPIRAMCILFNEHFHLFDFNVSARLFRERVTNFNVNS